MHISGGRYYFLLIMHFFLVMQHVSVENRNVIHALIVSMVAMKTIFCVVVEKMTLQSYRTYDQCLHLNLNSHRRIVRQHH